MAILIFAVVILLIGVVLLTQAKGKEEKSISTVSVAPLDAVAVVFVVLSTVKTVPTGHTGVVVSFGKVKDYTYEAGVHFDAPWIKVVNMDNRTQKETIDLMCFSSDIQEVSVTYTLNYQINKENAQNIYRTIGTN